MNNKANDNDKIDFMKFAIKYLESRVALVDNKTNLLIAATGILLGAYTFIIDKLLLAQNPSICVFTITIVCLALTLLLGGIVIFLLLQSVCPSEHIFWGEVPKIKGEKPKNYVMWPRKDYPDCKGDNFYGAIDNLSNTDIYNNYRHTHCLCLCLVRNKYHWYRPACNILKVLIAFATLSILGLLIIRFCPS